MIHVLDPVAVQSVRHSAGRHTLLASLDMDGVISRHQKDPRQATIDREVDYVVRSLVAVTPTIILSGRSTTFLARRAGNRGLWLFGMDGRAWITPEGLRYVAPSVQRHTLDVQAARRAVAKQLVDNKLFRYGVFIEQKDELGFAVHHGRPIRNLIAARRSINPNWSQLQDAERFLSEAAHAVPMIMEDVAKRYGLQMSASNRSCEMVGGIWSKRDGLLTALDQLRAAGVVIDAALHFGDSPSGDGPAFSALDTIETRDRIPTLAAAVATPDTSGRWPEGIGLSVGNLSEVPLVLSGIGELECYPNRKPSPLPLLA